MKVLYLTSEAYPLAKTGGLGDVSGALPAALAARGIDVRIMMPAYPAAKAGLKGKRNRIPLGNPLGAGATFLIEGRMPDSDVPAWLVDCPALFERDGGPYGDASGADWPDNHLRFALLCRAAAMVCAAGPLAGWTPDILHASDWQAGLAPAYLHLWGGARPATVFTVHNLQFQGLFPPSVMPEIGLHPAAFTVGGAEFHGQLSYLKAGLQWSERLTTVSPTYAREIQTPEMGEGLEGLLTQRTADLSGILNGVDYRIWDPRSDAHIAAAYGPGEIDGKAACKAALQREMGLPVDPRAPLFAIVSRLTAQKGLDLVLDSVDDLAGLGVQLVVQGTGAPSLQTAFRAAASAHPERVAVRIGYDEALAHRIQAGADVLMVPSRFEPCGLTQLYALRYATLPLVRHTGGLADTVRDQGQSEGTGFVFERPRADDLVDAVHRAVECFAAPDAWRAAQERAMAEDFGWDRAALEYQGLYTDMTS